MLRGDDVQSLGKASMQLHMSFGSTNSPFAVPQQKPYGGGAAVCRCSAAAAGSSKRCSAAGVEHLQSASIRLALEIKNPVKPIALSVNGQSSLVRHLATGARLLLAESENWGHCPSLGRGKHIVYVFLLTHFRGEEETHEQIL